MPSKTRIAQAAALVSLGIVPTLALAAGAARVDFSSGNVSAISASGAQRPLAKGAEVAPGETIATGDNGRTQLRFADGAQMSLQPKSEFRIEAYEHKGGEGDKGFFNLLRGGLRTITGLIGRGNKDAYRVTTQVATIGIRGTEYSVGYTGPDGQGVLIHTGEGAVEVCNAAGCVIVSGGESALVTGKDTKPTVAGSPPVLPPQQPPGEAVTPYGAGDCTGSGGGSCVLGADLTSGKKYAVAVAAVFDGSADVYSFAAPADAVFGGGSTLQSVSDSDGQHLTAGNVKGALAIDGVIGWGVWTTGSGVVNCDGACSVNATQLHYIAGLPTSTADISALQSANLVGTYSLAGYSLPTSESGVVGNVTGGTLTAHFAPAHVTVGVSLGVAIGGSSYALSGTGSTSGGSRFSGGDGSTFGFNGFFAGANASHAGIAYKFSAGGLDEHVMGAAAFRRTSTTSAGGSIALD